MHILGSSNPAPFRQMLPAPAGARVRITPPSEISLYLKAFEQLLSMVVHGADARTLIVKAVDGSSLQSRSRVSPINATASPPHTEEVGLYFHGLSISNSMKPQRIAHAGKGLLWEQLGMIIWHHVL